MTNTIQPSNIIIHDLEYGRWPFQQGGHSNRFSCKENVSENRGAVGQKMVNNKQRKITEIEITKWWINIFNTQTNFLRAQPALNN